MEDKRNIPNWHHQIVMIDREQLTIDGVTNMGSYDDMEIILETEHGTVIIKGEDLNVKNLNLEKGNLIVEGLFHSLAYDDHSKGARKGKGILSRLLK